MKDNQVILTEKAPKPIGPYSQAIRTGSFLFCSGQVPLDPVSGQIIGKTAAEQVKQVMKNCEAVLSAGGATFANVVKTTIFLKSMDDFPSVNVVYAEYFPTRPPARSTVEVSRLPKDSLVEIEMVATLF